MSRIGKIPIEIPKGVTVIISDGEVSVKGAKGTLAQKIDPRIKAENKENNIILTVESSDRKLNLFDFSFPFPSFKHFIIKTFFFFFT